MKMLTLVLAALLLPAVSGAAEPSQADLRARQARVHTLWNDLVELGKNLTRVTDSYNGDAEIDALTKEAAFLEDKEVAKERARGLAWCDRYERAMDRYIGFLDDVRRLYRAALPKLEELAALDPIRRAQLPSGFAAITPAQLQFQDALRDRVQKTFEQYRPYCAQLRAGQCPTPVQSKP